MFDVVQTGFDSYHVINLSNRRRILGPFKTPNQAIDEMLELVDRLTKHRESK